jgi:hypothetical protein
LPAGKSRVARSSKGKTPVLALKAREKKSKD